MTSLTFDVVRTAILDAGLEVFRAKNDTIELAERVRSHLMDAGIRVCVAAASTSVQVTVRVQRSDFASASTDELFDKVRLAIGPDASERGWSETSAQLREIRDPVDDARVLDVWFEVTFGKTASDTRALLDDLHWALRLPKCISH